MRKKISAKLICALLVGTLVLSMFSMTVFAYDYTGLYGVTDEKTVSEDITEEIENTPDVSEDVEVEEPEGEETSAADDDMGDEDVSGEEENVTDDSELTDEEQAEKERLENEESERAAAEEVSEVLAQQTYKGTFTPAEGYDLATIRYYKTGDSENYTILDTQYYARTAAGYEYEFTAEAGMDVVPEYYSTTVWDGAVDISWYDPNATEFYISNGAQLAGVAAIVSGSLDVNTKDYRVKGDRSLLEYRKIDNYTLIGAGGGNLGDTVYMGLAKNDFSNKTIYLMADINMGGQTAYTNWTPIGGIYPMDVSPDAASGAKDSHTVVCNFNGSINGLGHRIIDIYCDRHDAVDFGHVQGMGLVGTIGKLYEEENEVAPTQAPSVKNLSVSGYIHGRRMVGGIVGRIEEDVPEVYIENCANYATVIAHDAKGCGGIVGTCWGVGGHIINCYNTGNITNADYQCPTGGIAPNDSGLDVYCCYNVGQIYGAGNRGRAIGSHDSGTYTVSDCYYLEGCDNDPNSNGWWTDGLDLDVTCTAMTEDEMKTQRLVDLLNVNGNAFVYNAGGYPMLFWEADGGIIGQFSASVVNAKGGTISASELGTISKGTIVRLQNTLDLGWSFLNYTNNGENLSGNYVTVGQDSVISANYESMKAGVLNIEYNSKCTVSVVKDGTVMIEGVPTKVTDYPVESGDELYEYDVLKVTAVCNADAVPEDPSLVYSALVNPTSTNNYKYAFTYTGGELKYTTTNTFEVGHDITQTGVSLSVTVEPQTTFKMWSHVADTSWYVAGQKEFTLTNARQLAGMIKLLRNDKNNLEGVTIKLGNDISLANDDGTAGTRRWDGIGTSGTPFKGIFDGCGHMVYDMTAISTSTYLGLFNQASGAVIKNLTTSGLVRSSGGTAGIVGQCYGTTIANCKNYATIEDIGSNGGNGGIAGILREGSTISDCYNYGCMTGKDKIGGIAGEISDAKSMVIRCLNYGTISAADGTGSTSGIGGIVGKISSGGTLEQCANYGNISGASYYMGGVAGYVYGSAAKASAVKDCYNIGTVNNTSSYANAAVGGIIGNFNYCALSNSFNYGKVSAGEDFTSLYVGGVTGRDMQRSISTITNTYYLNTSASGSGTTKTGAVSKTAAEFNSTAFLNTLNVDGVFTKNTSPYPELTFAAGKTHVHSGGTATCCHKAVCDTCKMEYGDFDSDNHEGGTEIKNAKEQIWSFDGYTGDACCTDCGQIVTKGQVIKADQGKVVFTVYIQDFGETEPTVFKEYTAENLNTLALTCDTGYQYYQYWKNHVETKVVATKYVTLDAILADCGLNFRKNDSIMPSGSAAIKHSMFNEKKYTYLSPTERIEVPVSIAFCYSIGSGATAEELAEEASYTDVITFCYGIAEEDYDNIGGFRLVQGAKSITLIRGKYGYDLGDLNDDGLVDIYDAGLHVQYLNSVTTLTDEQKVAADANEDSVINDADTMLITNVANKKQSLD